MKHKYVIGIDGSGIDEMLKGIEEYKRWIKRKTEELSKRLADMGALYAQFNFDGALYSGNTDYTISAEKSGENAYKVKANGETVLFIEFGAGVRHGYGHPEVGEYGPGTYPGAGHWDDPKGWWYPAKDAGATTKVSKKTGQAWVHTYGNPPNAPMYNAVRDLERELEAVVREVFSD